MEKINLGSFYGFKIFIEVPTNMKDKEWVKIFEVFMEHEANCAIERYKTEEFQRIHKM